MESWADEPDVARPPDAAEEAPRAHPARRRSRYRLTTAVRLVCTVVLVTGLWTVAGEGTWAALSGTTANTGNTFSAGTVTMTDNDASGAMFTFTNQKPGVTDNRCITVNYTGSVNASTVKLYGTVTGTLAPYLNVTVTRGTDPTPSFSGCGGFVVDPTDYGLGPGVLFTGKLSAFPATHAAGLTDPLTPWTNSSTVAYRFTVDIDDTNAVQSLSSGATFTWEARS